MPDPWQLLEALISVLFLACMAPQLVWTLRRGRARDVSVSFLLIVLLASVIAVPYGIHTQQWWLLASWSGNLVVWGTVLYYRLRPRPGTVPANPETY